MTKNKGGGFRFGLKGGGFRFGLEAEFLLVDAASYRPLWHHDMFRTLNEALEAIPVEEFRCNSFKVEPPHRKPIPYIVEGYHLPDPEMKPIDLLPKGVEIRTPVYDCIEDCVLALKTLHTRLQSSLAELGFRAAALSFHPMEVKFEGPQNKQRHGAQAARPRTRHRPRQSLALLPLVGQRARQEQSP
jgi:hypothetical protein